MTAGAGVADWARALWATALAPLAMLGAVDVPARLAPAPAWFAPAPAWFAPAPAWFAPAPAWFAVTDTTPALLAAATAMAGPHAPPSLGVSACN